MSGTVCSFKFHDSRYDESAEYSCGPSVIVYIQNGGHSECVGVLFRRVLDTPDSVCFFLGREKRTANELSQATVFVFFCVRAAGNTLLYDHAVFPGKQHVDVVVPSVKRVFDLI